MPGPQEVTSHLDTCSVLVPCSLGHPRSERAGHTCVCVSQTNLDRQKDKTRFSSLALCSGTTRLSLPERRVGKQASPRLGHTLASVSSRQLAAPMRTWSSPHTASVPQTQAARLEMKGMTFPLQPQVGRSVWFRHRLPGCLRPWRAISCSVPALDADPKAAQPSGSTLNSQVMAWISGAGSQPDPEPRVGHRTAKVMAGQDRASSTLQGEKTFKEGREACSK